MNYIFFTLLVFLSLLSSSHQRFFLSHYNWDCTKCQVILIRTNQLAEKPITHDSFVKGFESYVNSHICIPGEESPECARLPQIEDDLWAQISGDSNVIRPLEDCKHASFCPNMNRRIHYFRGPDDY